MFRGSHLERYFVRLGASKSSSVDATSSSDHETSAYLNDGSALPTNLPGQNPESGTHSTESVNTPPKKPRVYPADDPRYDIEPVRVAMRSHETPHSVCNQPRKKRRSNPAVVLIPTASVPIGAQVVDLSVSTENQPMIVLSSDGGPIDEQLEEDDINPDVQEWLAAQKTSKVSYEATRRFQDTWAAKLHWAECVKGADGLYDFVKCIICR
jgi:hypothetical protein